MDMDEISYFFEQYYGSHGPVIANCITEIIEASVDCKIDNITTTHHSNIRFKKQICMHIAKPVKHTSLWRAAFRSREYP
jgi:hypothetical protein